MKNGKTGKPVRMVKWPIAENGKSGENGKIGKLVKSDTEGELGMANPVKW